MSETKHTPAPWNLGKVKKSHALFIEAPSRDICQMVGPVDKRREANAEFIVRACNAHEELVNICEDMANALEEVHRKMPMHRCTVDCPDIRKHVAQARAALDKAGVRP